MTETTALAVFVLFCLAIGILAITLAAPGDDMMLCPHGMAFDDCPLCRR